MNETSISNLGAFVKPEYRDVTYFHGIDFHQDIIDWPAWSDRRKTWDVMTMYVYLHEVSGDHSALHVIPGSHKFGATHYPHNLEKKAGNKWVYTDDQGNSMDCEHTMLTGGAGFVALWHNAVLHGTRATHKANNMRLSD